MLEEKGPVVQRGVREGAAADAAFGGFDSAEEQRQAKEKELEAAIQKAKKSEAQLRVLFAMIDAAGNADGEITLKELQTAIKNVPRARSVISDVRLGRTPGPILCAVRASPL